MAYLCSARTRQASSQCLNRRVVFLYTLMAIPFNKQYESPAYLAQLLQSRGLQMDSLSKAETCLKRYGYYRLSAYWHPLLQMPKTAHVFKLFVDYPQIDKHAMGFPDNWELEPLWR